MNFFYANGTPIINSLKVTSEVPLDPRLTVENIAERDSLVTNHISYDRMKVYVKSNDTKYIYHKDTGEWEIDNKFSEEDKSKLDKIDNYLIDTEHIYNPENKLLYREHSYDPNTDITTLRDHILQEARVSENGELYNGLLSKFYVNRLNNITNYLTDVSFTKGTDMPNLYLTTHSYNPDEDKTTLTNIDIPLATDDNHGLLSNLQNIKVNRIVDYINRIDTTHTNAPDTGLTYNYNIYNPFTNANVTKTILIPLVTHTENGLTSSSDKIKIDDIETYVKSIALRQVSGTEELGIDYIITNPNDQTDTPGYFNIPLVTDSRNGLVSPARKHWMDNADGLSNTGTTSDTWQLDKKDIDTRLDPNGGVIIKDSGGIAEIRNNTDSAYSDLTLNNITIKGNVTQEGKSFITEAETVEVRDNTLLLNRGETGAGVSREFAGIEIDRGSEPKYQILFDESDDRFKVGKEGDLWCVTLRDDEADMEDGMFTTWDASTKRLKTTNIVPANRNITFANGKDDGWSYSLKINENSGYLSIETFWHTLELDLLGSDFATFDLTKVTSNHRKFKFLKPIISDTIECTDSNYIEFYSPNHMGRDRELVLQLGYSKTRFAVSVYGTTFYRTSDNSEVLYHADIVNNLTSGGTNKVLSAEQGKLLQNSITSIQGSYLPLSGGTMTGSIIFPNRKGIFGRLTDGTSNIKIAVVNANNNVEIGNSNTPLMLVSNSTDLTHYRDNNTYEIWDKFNLSDPATSTDLANYLPLIGGTLTGQLTIKQLVDIKLILQSTDVDNYCIIQALSSQASQLGVFGYAGDKWAIGHGGTYYEIWDKYNLTNPVKYTTNTYNHATLTNKDGQYFTYIKAGTDGLLPHSKATLASGGSGLLGTSDQGFNAAYINHVHTNKITFGGTGPYIIGSTSATQFLDANGGVQKVATGGLYVGPSYASDALNLVPTNGIYSSGAIKSAAGFTSNFRQTNLNLAKTGNDVLYISSFVVDSTGAPGTDSNTDRAINDGMFLTYFWQNNNAFQLAADIDGTGIAYRHYIPSTGNSTTGWKFLADTSWVVSKINSSTSNYLPLTGGTLSGNLTINTVGSTTLVINNNDTNGSETFMRVLRKGTASAAIGFRDSLGAYIYNYNSNKYLFIDNDGYVRVGTTNGSTRLALITDIPTVSGYLPLSGGTMSGNISFNGDTGHIVVGARETSNFVSAVSFNKGSATNSAYIGYHSTGGSDSSGALILVPYPTSANPWAKAVGLYIAKNELLLDGKAIATQEYVTWNNVAGKPTIYERTIGINGTYWSFYAPINATSAMIYGPTSAGTSGQILQSTGGVPKWVNASSVVGNFVSKSGDTMTGALTMNSRRNNIVVDVVGGAGNSWDEGAGALSIQVPNDSGQTPLILARRSGAAINTTVATERLLSMELLDTGHSFIIGMSGSEALQLNWTSGKAGTGKLFGKTIATTDQIPSLSGYATTSDLNSLSGSVISVTTGINYIPVNLPAAVRTSAGAKKYLEWYDAEPGWYNFRLGYIDANGTISATGNVTAPKFIGALQGNADTATTASKLGSTTIGGSAKPIYLSSGTPTACSATVGSTTVPVYMNAGTITQCSTTLGVSITGTAATATKWNGYSIWTGTEDELPSSRDANTLYFVKNHNN